MVPKLMRSAPMTLLRSAISSGEVAMIGEAPRASVALADWFVTTLLVICLCYQFLLAEHVLVAETVMYLMYQRGEVFDRLQDGTHTLLDTVDAVCRMWCGYRCPVRRAIECADERGEGSCGCERLWRSHDVTHNCYAVQCMTCGRDRTPQAM